MHFQKLLHERESRLRAARLANLAFAYSRLCEVARRLRRADLRGAFSLEPPNEEAERFWPVLVPHAAAQSAVDEHFLDEDVVELSDVLAFLRAEGWGVGATFSLATLELEWLPRLGRALELAGVTGVAFDDLQSHGPAAPQEGDPLDGRRLG